MTIKFKLIVFDEKGTIGFVETDDRKLLKKIVDKAEFYDFRISSSSVRFPAENSAAFCWLSRTDSTRK